MLVVLHQLNGIMLVKLKEITIFLSAINETEQNNNLKKAIIILTHLINVDDGNFEVTKEDINLCRLNNDLNKITIKRITEYYDLINVFCKDPINYLDLICSYLKPNFVTMRLNIVSIELLCYLDLKLKEKENDIT